jgi:hypothetical protein
MAGCHHIGIHSKTEARNDRRMPLFKCFSAIRQPVGSKRNFNLLSAIELKKKSEEVALAGSRHR